MLVFLVIWLPKSAAYSGKVLEGGNKKKKGGIQKAILVGDVSVVLYV